MRGLMRSNRCCGDSLFSFADIWILYVNRVINFDANIGYSMLWQSITNEIRL